MAEELDQFALTGPPLVTNPDWMIQVRIARHVRNALGNSWTPRHDKLARRYLRMIREGRPLPEISPQSAGSPWRPDMTWPGGPF